MLRNWIAKFNRSISERVGAARHKHAVPIKLSFAPSGQSGKLSAPANNLVIMGETKDLSQTGIAFIVSSIRIKENYLVGEDRVLNAELDLPNGKVMMKVVGKRYEQVGEHISTARYLIGANITEMSTDDRGAYEEFLRLGGKIRKKAGELKFGIDG